MTGVSSSPVRTRIVGKSATMLAPEFKLALKASVRVLYTQSIRTEHVPNWKLAASLPLQISAARTNLKSSGGPAVRFKARAGRARRDKMTDASFKMGCERWGIFWLVCRVMCCYT